MHRVHDRYVRHALIAGATGIVGARIAERLHSTGWRVTGLCRRVPQTDPGYELVSIDLTDQRSCREKLAPLDTVTHVFYAARYDHPEGQTESVDVNAAMLVNLIEAVEPVASGLEHVHIVHGTKYYGHMLGPLPVPVPEESPRARVPNFYFLQEDFIRERQRGTRWTYTTSRPHTFCDFAADEPRNAALLIAMHATLAAALGLPLTYPGTQRSFHARTQFTFVPMLARAIEWMATARQCANQSYNVVNGDRPRWSELWPGFAAYFDLEPGGPKGVRLAEQAADKDRVWQTLVSRHGLAPVPLAQRVLWPYADYLFAPEWDIISSMSKARRDGFGETVDSARMFFDLFDRFRRDKIIP
jgi:nucleoside-diphosphate-sugar epimerase